MGRFDRNDASMMGRKDAESETNPLVGRVIEVFEQKKEGDYSNFEVDVKVLGADKQHRAIPVIAPSEGEVKVPKVNDKVMVEYRGGQRSQPVARQTVYTSDTRPPLGKAGVWRKRVDSDSSPAGDGDLYIESYTDYDTDPSDPTFTKDGATVQNSYIRIAKKAGDADDPNDGDSLPAQIELFDDPQNGEAHIKVELTQDGGSASTENWGLKFNLSTGEFKILDPEGYGIVSDGAGNFTWHHESIDFSEGTTDSL